jgi:nucleoid-associated protein YgaU
MKGKAMKKFLFILISAIVASSFTLGAQSLKANPDLQKSLEYKAKAASAFDSGEYDAAADYAREAKKYAALSDAYVEKMVAKAKAEQVIGTAKGKMAWADSVDAKAQFPAEYDKASGEYADAQSAYGQEDYAKATDSAREAIRTLDALEVAWNKAKADAEAAEAARLAAEAAARAAAEAEAARLAAEAAKVPDWPAVYVVRLIPQRRDCLWRIAEYPFIYNNPLKWPVIYEANKKTFRDPGNPNLIYPGQKLVIPSLNGEKREGNYDPSVEYPAFPKK